MDNNDNCAGYNFVECFECETGYFKNRNQYLVEINEELKNIESNYI